MTARRISRERDSPGRDVLVKQPLVGGHALDDRAGKDAALRQQGVVDRERADADRLREVSEHLPVREHGPAYVPAAVEAQQRRAILSSPVRHRPQRRNPAGVDLEIVDPARFAGQEVPLGVGHQVLGLGVQR